jgi:hypothetical protein
VSHHRHHNEVKVAEHFTKATKAQARSELDHTPHFAALQAVGECVRSNYLEGAFSNEEGHSPLDRYPSIINHANLEPFRHINWFPLTRLSNPPSTPVTAANQGHAHVPKDPEKEAIIDDMQL